MLIDFEDHPGVFMAHDLRASLDVGSRPDGVGCVGVAQIIWPDRSDARLLECGLPCGGYFLDRFSRPVDDIWTVRVLVLPAGEGGEQILTNGNVTFFQFTALVCVGHTDDAVGEVNVIPFQREEFTRADTGTRINTKQDDPLDMWDGHVQECIEFRDGRRGTSSGSSF